jgi:hypothetical protein
MDTIITIIGLTGCILASLYWGAELPARLPGAGKFFDRKPFNCRPCLTFHLTWLLAGLFAFIRQSAEVFTAGVTAAFIAFFIVKYIDNKKIIK